MQSVFRKIRKGGFIEYDKMVDFAIAIDEILEEIFTEPNHDFYKQIYSDLINPKNEYYFELEKLIEFAIKLAQTDIDKQQIKKFKIQVL